VLAIMIALYAIDQFLANQERAELHRVAEGHFASGGNLMSSGQTKLAIDNFGKAHSMERSNRQYELALISAEIAGGESDRALDLLTDALQRNSNDGLANLLMARAMAAQGRISDAGSFYHRAIYGEWPSDSSSVPIEKVRLELCVLLAKNGEDRQLLSELLLLQSEVGKDRATRSKIAGMFLQAGSSSHAMEAYRGLIQEDSRDGPAYAGLGRAEEMAGDYRAAELAFEHALRLKANDPSIPLELEMVAKLSALDPTSRRLSSSEKYRRSTQILSLVEDGLKACSQVSEGLLQEAEKVKAQKLPAAPTNEIAEARLELAGKLWAERSSVCKQPPRADDPLPILMKKLAQ
jgi:tetratricopeptide (TPR) repeat protein